MAQSAATPSRVLVAPNIGGDVFYGDYAFKVNTNNGTIIYNQAHPPVKLKATLPPAPAAPLDFFDRAAESAQLDLIINTHSRATVVGPDGVGKSTLLHQAANSAAAQKLPHGVVLAEGADADGTRLGINDVIQQLFDQLYDSEPYLKVTAATARVHLAQTQPLVLIDNVRFPSPDSLRMLIDLFPKSPILLAMPQSPGSNLTRLVDLGSLPRTDAVQLFAATLNQPTGKLNRSSIDAICAALNNVPLAITTVADVVRANSLTLDDALATLDEVKPASNDPVQVGLERAYGLVYSTLSSFERQVLAIAAALPAKSIDPDMIQRIMTGELATPPGGEIKREGDKVNIGGIRVPLRDAANIPNNDDTQPTTLNRITAAIDRLKNMRLLRANSPRLRLAPGLRLIAQAGIDQNAIKTQLSLQLLNDVRLNKHLDWQYCADELGNILGAIEWAARQKRWNAVIPLGRAIDPYLTLHGLWDAWRSVLDQILHAARSSGDRSSEAWALHQIGTQTLGLDNKPRAIEILRQALKLRNDIGDTIGAAYTQHNLDVLIAPPPIDRGRERPESQPPLSGVGNGIKFILGIVIVITAVLFSGAVAVGVDAFNACDRPVPYSPRASADMSAVIHAVDSTRAGEVRSLDFSEEMLNSYVHDTGAQQRMLMNGQARFVQPGLVVICGQLNEQYGNLLIAATVRIQTQADAPYQLSGISARAVSISGTSFGWVAVPNVLANSLIDQVNNEMGNFYRVLSLSSNEPAIWQMQVVRK